MAATQTAKAPKRRAKQSKANGAGRTATGQPSAANGSGVEPAVLEEILDALVAARDGDFSKRLSRRRRGLLGEIGAAYNELVTMNGRMEKEMARMRRVIGREGRMDQRASLGSAGGGWESSVESLNALIDDLVRPTTEVASVLDAVADGDLDRKMALTIEGQPVKGEFLRIGTTVNTMVDQLSSFADEVTRVAREVGTEGKLGGQAEVKGVSGTWRDLTESVNGMASNLTGQVRNISQVAQAVARGDLTQKITVEAKGEVAELADTMNEMTDTLAIFAEQVTSVAREVGTDGKLGGQAEVPNVSGTWKDLTESVNGMASNLTSQVRNIAQVMTAVAGGDLTQRITVDVKGEILELKITTNTMVDQLSSFADEVTRVAREVGTDGKLGGQAAVPNVAGNLEGPHRLGEPDGVEPDEPGPQHRAGHDGGGRGRPVAEGHRGREGRDRGAEGDREHHGRPALVVRRRGHASGPRGRHGGNPRRPGRGEGRLRDLARSHGVRELHGLEPDRPGALDRPGLDRGRRRRPLAEDHASRPRARWPRSRTRSTRWSTVCARSRRRSRASRARWVPRASSAARPRWRTCPAPGAASRRT